MKSNYHYFFKLKLRLFYAAIIISLLLFIPENAPLQAFLHIKKLNPIPNVVIDNQKIKNTCLSITNSFVKDIINRIKNGGPFYYKHDGILFHNFEKKLPAQLSSPSIYLEYTVGPPDMANRGVERIITDNIHMHWFYTQDHYMSFLEIKNC
ncbi:MAG TPA: ribonuclease domain-containing protein [Candidatus Nitrosocosmicus sp.]